MPEYWESDRGGVPAFVAPYRGFIVSAQFLPTTSARWRWRVSAALLKLVARLYGDRAFPSANRTSPDA